MTATTRGVGWISNAEKLLAQQLLRRLIYPKFPPLALRRLWQTDMIRDYCLYEAYLNLRLKTLNKSRNVGEILALIYVALYSVISDQHISHISLKRHHTYFQFIVIFEAKVLIVSRPHPPPQPPNRGNLSEGENLNSHVWNTIKHTTGWPFSLFKTSRWHWRESCVLI